MTKEMYKKAYEEIESAVLFGSISVKGGMARIAMPTFEYYEALSDRTMADAKEEALQTRLGIR